MALAVVRHGPASIEKPPEPVQRAACRLPWAWDGLCFAVPFDVATRDSARDVVGNAVPAEWAGTPTFIKDNRGNIALDLADSYIGYTDNAAHNKPSTGLTAYVRMRRGVGTLPARGIFAKVHTPVYDPWTTWGMQATDADATKLAASVTVNGANYYWENSSYTTDTSTWLSIFLRWASGTTPVQSVLGERGQPYSVASYGGALTGTLSYSDTGEPIRLGIADSLEAGTYQAAFSQAMVWSRRLSDIELQSLVADPYGWYSPRRETATLAGPVPIVWATTFRVIGYAMFATTEQRDGLRAELQAWLDAHVSADVWASGVTVSVGPDGSYALPAGFATPNLMDMEDTPGGPWPGLTWAFETATKELRDSFGAIPGLGSVWADYALTGSQFGEATS